jgi:hypothetical protein
MDRITGNTTGTFTSTGYDLPMIIENFFLVNKGAGASVVNVYRIGSATVNLSPLSKSLAAGEVYENIRPTVLLAAETISVQVSGNIDYDFTLSNSVAPTSNPES